MTSSSQNTQRGRGQGKRFWKKEEEDTLIEGLLELSVDPKWKAENGFKNDYMTILENKLEEKFPGCGLKADPHIESKFKWFKDKYTIINDMLNGTSGFKWDDTTKMITCERQSYDDSCQRHPKAKGLWRTPFRFLDSLDAIYGFDRANGKPSESFEQAVEDLGNEVINLGSDANEEDDTTEKNMFPTENATQSTTDMSPEPPTKKLKKEKTPKAKGKRKLPEVVDLTENMGKMTSEFSGFMKDMNTHISIIASAMNTTQKHEESIMKREQESIGRKEKLLFHLGNLPGISKEQSMAAATLFSLTPSHLDIFFATPDPKLRRDFVLAILRSTPNV